MHGVDSVQVCAVPYTGVDTKYRSPQVAQVQVLQVPQCCGCTKQMHTAGISSEQCMHRLARVGVCGSGSVQLCSGWLLRPFKVGVGGGNTGLLALGTGHGSWTPPLYSRKRQVCGSWTSCPCTSAALG
jgi:hypothetical protein